MSVYFLRSGGLVKIGKASDPAARVRALQTASPIRLTLLAVAPIQSDAQSYEIERRLHEMFAWSRKRGEFFDLSVPLRQLIAAVAAGVGIEQAMADCQSLCARRTKKRVALVKSKLTTPPVAENAARRRKRLRAEQRAEGAAGG